jgi:MFS family permease
MPSPRIISAVDRQRNHHDPEDGDPVVTETGSVGPDSRAVPGARPGSLAAFVGAYFVTLLGDRFAEIALPVLILAVTHSPAAAGAVGVAIQAPTFLLALWLGGRVDRHSRRALLVSSDVVRAVCFAILAWLASSEVASLWPYLVVGLVVGSGNVLFAIAGQAILPQIVAGRHLVRANAMLEAGDALTTVSGPAVAGAVVANVGAAVALLANAVSFVVSALLLGFGVKVPGGARPSADDTATADQDHRPARGARAMLGRALDQARFVFGDSMQSSIQVALSGLSAHGAAVVLAIIVLARSELGLSVARIGILLGAAGAGGLVASAVTAKWPRFFSTVQGIVVTVALSAAFLVLLAFARGFLWALLANGLLDMAVTAAFIATASVRQQRTPANLMGRVTAVSIVCNAAARVVGVGGVGVLLTVFGGRVALLADATVLAAAAALAWVRADRSGQ